MGSESAHIDENISIAAQQLPVSIRCLFDIEEIIQGAPNLRCFNEANGIKLGPQHSPSSPNSPGGNPALSGSSNCC
uniref:Uncharacterized protein n=1 Tax=Parascaris equorum TaxID=6256 RepID=A0A914R1R9_PAREQ